MHGENAFSKISISQNRFAWTGLLVVTGFMVSSAVPIHASGPVSHSVSPDTSPSDRKSVNLEVAALPQTGATRAGRNAAGVSGQVPLTQNRQTAEIQANLFTGGKRGSAVVTQSAADGAESDEVKRAVNENSKLFEGTTLFVPEQDLEVSTTHGNIHISGKSVVLISSNGEGLAVYDIHDGRKGSIKVTAGTETYPLAPGRHILISTDKSGEFASANALELIPHSDVKQVRKSEKQTVYKSEFSIPSAINSVSALKELMKSDDPELHKIAGKIAKTASILLYMRTANYQQYFRPRVTTLTAR